MGAHSINEILPITTQNPVFQFNASSMTHEKLPPLLLDLWKLIFSYGMDKDLKEFKSVCKSWHFVAIDRIDNRLKDSADILAQYHPEVFAQWKSLAKTQQKAVNWPNILKQEKSIDQVVLENKVIAYPSRSVDFPASVWTAFQTDFFVFQGMLVVCGASEAPAAAVPEDYTLNLFPLFSDNDDSKKTHEKVFSIHHLTNRCFATVIENDDHFCAVRLFELKSNTPKGTIQRFQVKHPVEIVPFIKGREFVITHCYGLKESKNTVMNLTFLSFDFGQISSVLQLTLNDFQEGFSRLNHYIEDLTDQYVIIVNIDPKKQNTVASYSFFHRTTGFLLLNTTLSFTKICHNMVLFWNKAARKIVRADLSQSNPQPVPLIDLNKCIGLHMTPNTYYFVDETHIHVYDVQSQTKESFLLLQPSTSSKTTKKISKCTFIRVTDRLIMLSLTIGIYDRVGNGVSKSWRHVYDEIISFDVHKARQTGMITNTWTHPKTQGMFLSDRSWIADVKIEDEAPDDANRHTLRGYQFGYGGVEKNMQLFNTTTFHFGLKQENDDKHNDNTQNDNMQEG